MSCHHRLTKNPIELTYPQCNYYNLEMENACFLQIDFKQFYTVCPYDFLQVGPSHRICGLAKSGTTQLVPVNSNSIQISLVRTNPNSFDQYELMVKPISCLPPSDFSPPLTQLYEKIPETENTKPNNYNLPNLDTSGWRPSFYRPNYVTTTVKPPIKPTYLPNYTLPRRQCNWLNLLKCLINDKIRTIQSFLRRRPRRPYHKRKPTYAGGW